jgi:catechol 2,3-dioxygenase-like lactoylglutathione lyase family enzyme
MRGRRRGDASEDRWQRRDWWNVVLDSPDPHALAAFYSALLDWPLWTPEGQTEPDPGGAAIDPGEGVGGISFQLDEDYVRPVWPAPPGAQRMMMHLDLQVDDLDEAVAHAVELGAELAAHQPQDDVRVMLDPDGHPFCLYT